MYNWVVIQDNEIVEYHHEVPLNWRHVSNLSASQQDLEFMRSVGWVPVQAAQMPEFNSQTHQITEWNYEISDDVVLATATVTEKPVQLDAGITESERELISIARLQSELDHWKEILEPQMLAKLAAKIVEMDAMFVIQIRNMIANTFTELKDQNNIPGLHNLTTETVREHIRFIVEDMLAKTSDHAVGLEQLWREEADRIKAENSRWLARHQTYFLQELENIRQKVSTMVGEVPYLRPDIAIIDAIRWDRTVRLMRTDWTQFPDAQSGMDQETKDRWLRYRQALRDVPQVYEQSGELSWPEF